MNGYVMKSKDQRIADLKADIKYLLSNNPVTVLQISKKGLKDMHLAKKTFGKGSNVEAEALSVVKEIQAINYIEERLLKYIAKNVESFDIDSAEKVVLILDKLSRTTFADYEDIIAEIEEAIATKDQKKDYKLY